MIGIGAIVASLVFVGIQVKQSQSSANVDQIASYGEMMLELRSLLTEHADVWQRACADEELTAEEKAQSTHLFRAYLEFTWVNGVAANVGMFDYQQILAERMAANLHRYPGFARMAQAHSQWETGTIDEAEKNVQENWEFTQLVMAKLQEYREREPNPQFDPALCGI